MRELFLTIAEITLAMSPVLLLALLLSRFGRRFSAGCRYAVWCLLLLRLAIPVNISFPAPVVSLTPPADMPSVEQVFDHLQIPAVPMDVVSVDANLPTVTDGIPDDAYVVGGGIGTSPFAALDLVRPATLVWAVGALAVLLWQAVVCLAAEMRVHRWKLPATDARLTAALARAKDALGIKRTVSIWLCPGIHSPMLHGLIRPEILLPHGEYDDEALDAILRHELTHARRGDLWWKLIGIPAVSLHFFNPLVWIARKQQEIEMEQSCDEAVFRTGDVSRKVYGETMLAVAREGLEMRAVGLNTHFHASAKTLKARFRNILDSSARRTGLWLIAAALAVTLLVCGFVSCRAEMPPDPITGEESGTVGHETTDGGALTDPAVTIGTETTAGQPHTPYLNLVAPMLNLKEPVVERKFGYYTDENGVQAFCNGTLYAVSSPRAVYAAAPGTVTSVERNDSLGLFVILDHGGERKTVYGRLGNTSLEAGMQIAQSGYIGQTGEENTLYFAVSIDGAYVDPEQYLRWELKPVFSYTLDNSLPRLRTWNPLENPEFPPETVSRMGSEYTAIAYMLTQLYGEDHSFGRFTLLPEQIVIDGQTMDSVWEIHQSSYSSIWFAMTKYGGAIYQSENKTAWRAVRNGNFTSTLDSRTVTGEWLDSPSPLFRERVWMVHNEQYDVVLTGVATVEVYSSQNGTLPSVFTYTIDEDMPEMISAERIADPYLSDAVKARVHAEYLRVRTYIEQKYGEAHDYISAHLMSTAYEGFESVWNIRKKDGSGFALYMKPAGEAILVGSLWSAEDNRDTVWASAPRYSDSDPYGDAVLKRSTKEPLFPCDVIFNLP